MEAAKACMAAMAVVLAGGCLEKPERWVPDGLLPDTVLDGETGSRDGRVTGDLADLGGSDLAPDADVHPADLPDGDLGPEDGLAPEAGETVELEVLPDADVPEVVPEGSVARGTVVTPGIGGAWGERPFRACVSWHRNTLVKGE